MTQPAISIVVPIYNMENALFFLQRNLSSIAVQTFRDYEVVISDDSSTEELKDYLAAIDFPVVYVKNPQYAGMANNTNNAINHASGKLIKILFQDDYFYQTQSLAEIIHHFTPHTIWLATGCTHSLDGINTFNDHKPYYSESENTIGSPSVITFKREVTQRFDPNFKWTLDLDYYKQLYREYGKPKILDQVNVVIGIHSGQETNKLSQEYKVYEHQLLKMKYENSTH